MSSHSESPLLVAFVVNEQRDRNPLVPFSIFRIKRAPMTDAIGIVPFQAPIALIRSLSCREESRETMD